MDFDDVDGDAAWWIAAHAVTHADKDDCDVCCYFGLDCEIIVPTPLSQTPPPPPFPASR
jgi:hypothetical protein